MNRYVAALFVAALLWGCSWIPLKALGGTGIHGLTLTLGTYGLLALFSVPALLRQNNLWQGRGRALIWIGLLGGGANLSFTLAMVYGDVVRAMTLFYLLPLWGVLGGRFILGESVDRWRWFGVVMALLGAWLVLGGTSILSVFPSWSELAGLLAGLLYAMNNLVFRGVQQVPLGSKLSAMFFGCALLSLAGLYLSGTESPPAPSDPSWGWLGLYALGWLLPATIGSQWGITHLEAGRASVILIVELVAAVVSATLIGNENLAPLEWVGALLIIAAALIEALRGSRVYTPASDVNVLKT